MPAVGLTITTRTAMEVDYVRVYQQRNAAEK